MTSNKCWNCSCNWYSSVYEVEGCWFCGVAQHDDWQNKRTFSWRTIKGRFDVTFFQSTALCICVKGSYCSLLTLTDRCPLQTFHSCMFLYCADWMSGHWRMWFQEAILWTPGNWEQSFSTTSSVMSDKPGLCEMFNVFMWLEEMCVFLFNLCNLCLAF